MNAAAVQNAATGAETAAIAREQMKAAEERQKLFDPKYMALIDQAMASQKTADDRSAEQWDLYKQIGLPAEQRLAETAANYDTPERRAEAAAAAGAAVEQQGNAQREAQTRALGRAGVSLGSGRALTLDNASRLQQSKATVGAEQAARDKVEATGMSLTDNVAKLGRGISSTGLQAAQLALGAGSTASGMLGQQQSTYGASLAPGFQAYGLSTGANSSAGNIYGNVAQLNNQSSAGAMSGLMGLGQLAGQAGMMYMMSSKKLKTERKGGRTLDDAVLDGMRAMPEVESWRYKKGLGDDRTHVGEYAEDSRAQFGDKVAPQGKALNVGATFDRNRSAIAALMSRLDQGMQILEQLEAA
ncbi:MAG TPA: hypothetical protein VGF12_06975 [Roseateles sp.]|uniref:hypothetical protein n=1 Tax=Roseateles sp. TaxID=1971397 RepID=UPI002ED8AA75